MELHRYEETHSLYIDLADGVSADSQEVSDDFIVDHDAAGHVVVIRYSARLKTS